MAFFCAADALAGATLEATGVAFPSSIAALLALGTVATVPAAGSSLQLALGPAAAWLRASLPLLLVPPFLMPLVVELPPTEQLPRLGALAVGSLLATTAIAARLAVGLAAGGNGGAAPTCASTAAAQRFLSSIPAAGCALMVGTASTALLASGSAGGGDDGDDAAVRTPLYLGLTLVAYASYVSIAPAPLRAACPPNIGAAFVLAPALLVAGGATELQLYLSGAGEVLMACVQPAMVTLGLYAHTHRAALRRQSRPLAALALAAPLLSLATALGGSALGLPPPLTAAVLPASTTTGLALTMPRWARCPLEAPVRPLPGRAAACCLLPAACCLLPAASVSWPGRSAVVASPRARCP